MFVSVVGVVGSGSWVYNKKDFLQIRLTEISDVMGGREIGDSVISGDRVCENVVGVGDITVAAHLTVIGGRDVDIFVK